MGSENWKKNAPFLQGLGKEPTWKCQGCGRDGNWHKRAFCRCGREPPSHVCKAQRRSMDAKGDDRRDGRARSSDRQPERQGNAKSYADAARTNDSGNKHTRAKVDQELDNLRKQLAAERKEKEALQARAKGAHEDEEMDDADDDGGEARDARITTLTSDLQSVARVCGETSAAYKSAKNELEKLLKERREGKPLRTQLQSAERRISRQKTKIERLSARSGELEERIKELQDEQSKADEDLLEAMHTLATFERERKQLLLREVRAADDGGGEQVPAAARAPAIDDATAWSQVCAAVSARASQPGADPLVAQQLASLMQGIVALCQKLGGDGGGQVSGGGAVIAAAGSDTTSTAMPTSAATGDTPAAASSGADPTSPAAPATPLPPPAPNAADGAEPVQQPQQPLQQLQPELGGELAVPVAPAAPAAQSNFFIGEAAQATVDAAGTDGHGAQAGNGGAEGDRDGYHSADDADDNADDMDIETSLAGIPADQRGRVRDALARKRLQQKPPRKLKKQVDEPCRGVAGDAKKPNKA